MGRGRDTEQAVAHPKREAQIPGPLCALEALGSCQAGWTVCTADGSVRGRLRGHPGGQPGRHTGGGRRGGQEGGAGAGAGGLRNLEDSVSSSHGLGQGQLQRLGPGDRRERTWGLGVVRALWERSGAAGASQRVRRLLGIGAAPGVPRRPQASSPALLPPRCRPGYQLPAGKPQGASGSGTRPRHSWLWAPPASPLSASPTSSPPLATILPQGWRLLSPHIRTLGPSSVPHLSLLVTTSQPPMGLGSLWPEHSSDPLL